MSFPILITTDEKSKIVPNFDFPSETLLDLVLEKYLE